MANRNDDAAFERVVNTPTRGVGDRTLDVVRQTARERQMTLWQATRELLQSRALAGRAASALQRFCELVDSLATRNRRVTAACSDRPGHQRLWPVADV